MVKRTPRKPAFEDMSPYGTMSKALGAAKTKSVTTSASVITDARSFSLSSVSTPGDGLYPNGSYLNVSLSAGIADVYPSGLPSIYQNFDMFRFTKAEVFVGNEGEAITIFSSVDLDDALPTLWPVYRTRKNIAMTSLSSTVPLRSVGSWRPVGNFSVSTASSTPFNVVPSDKTWYDCSAVSQQFLGLKLHIASTEPAADVQIFAKLTIEFRSQV